ncbi:hypothetical protein R1sor_013154 [Riccia sorocarpa]|uniref:Uncharacterized protein n=1 Tax=Riccia sorocarpa TaxID=122646 RepID=A0ABD3H911_9MARC
MDSLDSEIARVQAERRKKEKELAAFTSVTFDKDLYGAGNRFEGYDQSIAVNEEEDEERQDALERVVVKRMASYTAPKSVLTDVPRGEATDEALGFRKPQRIIDREDDYRKRRLRRALSPERHDAFAAGSKTPDVSVRTYADVMREEMLKRETEETLRLIAKKRKTEETEPNRSKPASTREVRGRESEVTGTRTKPASTREIHGFRESEVIGNRTKPTSTREVHSRRKCNTDLRDIGKLLWENP